MGPKRFVASTAAEALKKIKAEIGSEAIVLSNREVPEGIEIVAIEPDALKALAHASPAPQQAVRPSEPASPPLQRPAPLIAHPPAAHETSAPVFTPPPPVFTDHTPPPRPTIDAAPVRIEPQIPNLPPAQPSPPAQPECQGQLLNQLTEVRSMLETHLAGNYWGQMQQHAPSHAEITKRLLNAGFSPKLCAQLIDDQPTNLTTECLLESVQKRLEARIKTLDPFGMFDTGGVFAFIGPTGVGKTTTVAKVAARCVLRYGRDQVALLTTDTYRIGAQEQLRVFAKILGLPVIALRDSDDLNAKIKELSRRKIILLDTAGVSQRDIMMLEQLRLIGNGCKEVHRILVLSATTSLRTLEEVIQAHRKATDGTGIYASVITKVDEAAVIAPAIDCVLRNELPILFLSNGQRVPEDLYPPNVGYLSHRTLKPRHYDTESDMSDREIPALIADSLAAWNRRVPA